MRDSLAISVGLGPITIWWSGLIVVLAGAALLWRGKWNMLQTGAMPEVASPEVLAAEV